MKNQKSVKYHVITQSGHPLSIYPENRMDYYCVRDQSGETLLWTREKAKAHLMASGPDLLAALEVLTKTPTLRAFIAEQDPMALKQAEQAIAKATGDA